MTLPTTIQQARDERSPKYFTGKPCKYGHIANRITANGTCVECSHVQGGWLTHFVPKVKEPYVKRSKRPKRLTARMQNKIVQHTIQNQFTILALARFPNATLSNHKF